MNYTRPIGTRRLKYALMIAALVSWRTSYAADLDLSAYRGKVVYVDFWASWCGPCKQSFPWLDEMVRHYGAQNLIVIGVNVDKDRARAERFLEETPATFPIVFDPKGELDNSLQSRRSAELRRP